MKELQLHRSAQDVHDSHLSGREKLERLGYRQELKRGLSLVGNVALTLAAVAPATSILAIGPAVLAQAGTGIFFAYLFAAVIAVCLAMCYAELGSAYPTAGGSYVIANRVLAKPVGLVILLNGVVLTVLVPAIVALSFGSYLSALVPRIDPSFASCVAVLVATGLALLSISENAWITKLIVMLELVLLGGLLVLGAANVHQPLGVLLDPVAVSSSGSESAVGLALVLAAVTAGLFSYNGYQSAVVFSEETQGQARKIGRGVMTAVFIGILSQLLPLAAVILAAPDLGVFLNSEAPFTHFTDSIVGPTANVFVTIGILFAVFASIQTIVLTNARFLYATGRDMIWPRGVSSAFGRVSARCGSPWVCALVVGGLAAVLTFFSDVVQAVTFTGVLLATNYALVAVCALVSRLRQSDLSRPWRMPLWPLPPVVALIGLGIALSQQDAVDLLIVPIIAAVGAIYYTLFLHPRGSAHWSDPKDISKTGTSTMGVR